MSGCMQTSSSLETIPTTRNPTMESSGRIRGDTFQVSLLFMRFPNPLCQERTQILPSSLTHTHIKRKESTYLIYLGRSTRSRLKHSDRSSPCSSQSFHEHWHPPEIAHEYSEPIPYTSFTAEHVPGALRRQVFSKQELVVFRISVKLTDSDLCTLITKPSNRTSLFPRHGRRKHIGDSRDMPWHLLYNLAHSLGCPLVHTDSLLLKVKNHVIFITTHDHGRVCVFLRPFKPRLATSSFLRNNGPFVDGRPLHPDLSLPFLTDVFFIPGVTGLLTFHLRRLLHSGQTDLNSLSTGITSLLSETFVI
jgi:hypothetical protein